ncbi:MAG: hypothetical protein HYV76_02475 [Candidatus Vogelbacteria bacterium]|nr:hypothetical protein [Candidatus Vogelbacteria bacterium]
MKWWLVGGLTMFLMVFVWGRFFQPDLTPTATINVLTVPAPVVPERVSKLAAVGFSLTTTHRLVTTGE